MITGYVLPPVLKKMGFPRLIITGFLLVLFILTPFVGVDLPTYCCRDACFRGEAIG